MEWEVVNQVVQMDQMVQMDQGLLMMDIRLPPLATLKPRETPEPAELQVPTDIDPLDFFQAVIVNPYAPLALRQRAAEAKAQYLYPKLAATAVIPTDGDFAARLERAAGRSAKVIEGSRALSPLSNGNDFRRRF